MNTMNLLAETLRRGWARSRQNPEVGIGFVAGLLCAFTQFWMLALMLILFELLLVQLNLDEDRKTNPAYWAHRDRLGDVEADPIEWDEIKPWALSFVPVSLALVLVFSDAGRDIENFGYVVASLFFMSMAQMYLAIQEVFSSHDFIGRPRVKPLPCIKVKRKKA